MVPIDPAIEDPIRFFDVLRSTRAAVEVLRTYFTMWAGTMASATTDLPRPSTQFTAAGFLSVQKFPTKQKGLEELCGHLVSKPGTQFRSDNHHLDYMIQFTMQDLDKLHIQRFFSKLLI